LLFLILVIIFPVLTKKRTQCGIFCPFGAFQSVVGIISPYRIRKDKTRCILCRRCEKVCPVFAMDEVKARIICIRCGSCIDACQKSAIDYDFVCNVSYKTTFFSPRTLFLFTSIVFFGIFSAGFAINGILRIIEVIIW
jgi:polyferredoxin